VRCIYEGLAGESDIDTAEIATIAGEPTQNISA
jgi:hypothetical protein